MVTFDKTRRGVLRTLASGAIVGSTFVGTASAEETASVTFDEQQVSNGKNQSVVVESVTLPEPGGFVDIHDRNNTGRFPLGEIHGANDNYLPSGTHENIVVPLFEDFNCFEFDAERLQESKTLMAMPHKDQPHDRTYTHFCDHEGRPEDGGFWNPDGSLVLDEARVNVPPDGRGNPSEEGENNRSKTR